MLSPFQICGHVHPQQPQSHNQIPQHHLPSLQTHGGLRHLQLSEFLSDWLLRPKGLELQEMIMQAAAVPHLLLGIEHIHSQGIFHRDLKVFVLFLRAIEQKFLALLSIRTS